MVKQFSLDKSLKGIDTLTRPGAGFVTLPNSRRNKPQTFDLSSAAAASRQVCMADDLKARCVLAEVRWRWTLKVFWRHWSRPALAEFELWRVISPNDQNQLRGPALGSGQSGVPGQRFTAPI